MYHRIFRQSEVRRESNHYNSNCLLCQRCWLLCTTYGECKAPRTCEDNVGHSQDFFYSTHRRAMSANNIVLQNIIHYCTCKPTFSYVMHTVHGWKQCGPFMALQSYEWTSCKFNKTFFFEQLSRRYIREFGFLIENTARYLEQYLFCVSMQYIHLFLSIMLNWSFEGNLTVNALWAGESFCLLKLMVRKVTFRL